MKFSKRFHIPQLNLSHWHDWLKWRFTDAQRFLMLCMIAGVLCGLAAVCFHVSITFVFSRIWRFMMTLELGQFVFIMPFVPALGGLIAGVLLYTCAPNAAGSGIPQTKVAYYRDFGVIRIKEGMYRFLLGCIFVGFGGSLGREGPTVHMCSAIASSLGQAFGLAKQRIRAMVPVGMGAGIAAAFNAPMSAITFVFEELLGDFNSRALGGILVAVVIAAVVERSILGEHPAFEIDFAPHSTGLWMLVCIPLGIVAGLLGHLFVSSLLKLRGGFQSISVIPEWLKPALGGLVVGILGTGAFLLTREHGVFSIGYGDLGLALAAQLLGKTMFFLFVAKFIATIFSYASGGSGGLFSPVLFFGGMMGGLLGALMKISFDVPDQVIGGCSLLGMGAFFAAIIRCPMTSILIIFEMTLDYSLILPLMAGNMIAYFIASRLRSVPLYDALLLQDKINLRKLPSYRGKQDYRNLPVSTIMTYDTVNLYSYMRPEENIKHVGQNIHKAYPVLDENNNFKGMLTHSELTLLSRNNPDRPLKELIHEDQSFVFVHPESSVQFVARTLVDKEVLYAPVISRTDPGRLLGMVTLHDITRQQYETDDLVDFQA